jgi:transcriptional regulator GlxA family with amidase domain
MKFYLYAMKKIAILVPELAVMQTIADPQQLFTAVNQHRQLSGKPTAFDIQLVGLKKQVKLNNGLFSVRTNKLLQEVQQVDLVFVPAISGDLTVAIKKNQALVPWIVEQYNKGAEIASLCVGTFLLASTGLLDGKKCSTHWGVCNEFRRLYPSVELIEGNVITEEKRIYSSGGSHSYWNLLLYLLEKYTSREAAVLASKYFAIDIDRNSQAVFSMFKGQKIHKDQAVLAAQEYIEKNVHEKISIDTLSKVAAIGRRTLERRFKQATYNSVLEYIQRVKIEAAKRLFESSRKNIHEVMYDVGYMDIKAFRDLFKKLTGVTPVEYRVKYNKLAAIPG